MDKFIVHIFVNQNLDSHFQWCQSIVCFFSMQDLIGYMKHEQHCHDDEFIEIFSLADDLFLQPSAAAFVMI